MSTRIVMGLLVVFLVGCATQQPQSDRPEAPSPPAPDPRVSDFFMRQSLEAQFGDKEMLIDAVVQYDQGVITTVFLNPIGKPAVIIRQQEQTVDISGPSAEEVPFDLKWTAHDIALALVLTPLEIEGRNGKRERGSGAFTTTDTWRAGRLVERVAPQKQVRIQYSWDAEQACPTGIEIHSERFDYQLIISTTQCRMGDQ